MAKSLAQLIETPSPLAIPLADYAKRIDTPSVGP